MNILLTLSYDGTNYCGWQRQPNGITVQQRLEEALTTLYGQEIIVTGASRTDAGVHAAGQRAMFFIDENPIPLDKLPYAINSKLPDDIVITCAETVDDDFHPVFRAKRKTYEYVVQAATFPDPLLRNRCCFVNHPLDIKEMRRAAAHLTGEHDFAAFRAAGGSAKTTVRTVYSLEIIDNSYIITMRITGNGFLYNMVRIIAGTLIYVGGGKLCADDIPGILASGRRESAGKTAPPQGLALMSVEY